MHIAMIGQKGIPATYGGVERHVEELGRRLVERGHRVTVYTRPHYTPPGTREYEGVRLVSLHSLPTKHLDAISHTTVCSFHAAVQDADVVHYHAIGPALLSWLPKLAGKKVVCTIHGQDWRRPKWGRAATAALRLGERAAMSLPHATISVSETLAAELSRVYGRPVHFIPNGVTLVDEVDDHWLEQLALQPQGYVLFASRIVPEKGLHYLLDVWRRGRVDVPLVVAGDSSFSQEYVDGLKKDAPAGVHFVGYVFGAKLASLFRGCGLFVLPSDLEGLPIVLLEALGYGAPVLASDIPPNKEVLGTFGATFRAGDVDDLETQLLSCLTAREEARRQAAVAQARVRDEFNWDRVTTSTEALYSSLIEKR
jgi:glycosyltransferase involved in cell wall biosynthesis